MHWPISISATRLLIYVVMVWFWFEYLAPRLGLEYSEPWWWIVSLAALSVGFISTRRMAKYLLENN